MYNGIHSSEKNICDDIVDLYYLKSMSNRMMHVCNYLPLDTRIHVRIECISDRGQQSKHNKGYLLFKHF